MKSDTLLMVAASEHDANMLYAVGMFVPDPFIYLRIRGRCHIAVSDLELGRARKQAPHCRIHSLNRLFLQLERDGVRSPGLTHVIRRILKEQGLRKVFVPESFPVGLANDLRRRRIKVKARRGEFFPERQLKTADEVKKISAALTMAEVGLAEGIQAIRLAKVGRKRRLMYHNAPLTSEKLQAIINTAIIQVSGIASHTIVAGGNQACDPHESGHGVLRANEPIILDVFPRSQKTGYYGDITRTVVKGRASEAVRKLYDTVARAQDMAFTRLQRNAQTAEVHRAVQKFFDQEGCKTRRDKGRMEGFFHGTGHGLGLEIHEPPRMGISSPGVLRAGNVVTVEPGLYYPGLGGVRLEDVALVTTKGPRNLTRFEKVLEI